MSEIERAVDGLHPDDLWVIEEAIEMLMARRKPGKLIDASRVFGRPSCDWSPSRVAARVVALVVSGASILMS